jgi:hypothetical protein
VGNNLFPMKVDAGNKEFVLDVGKSQLENATAFDKDNWPNMADHFPFHPHHYGFKRYWEDAD